MTDMEKRIQREKLTQETPQNNMIINCNHECEFTITFIYSFKLLNVGYCMSKNLDNYDELL